jgi:glycosyltransferase involved in cell wall biosynthesis
MKLLFVCKRHPQQRDLIERPYGRFYHLPTQLAALGHEVRVLLCSHRKLASLRVRSAGVEWVSGDLLADGPYRYLQQARAEARAFQPDWVIGLSDTYCGWLARRLAKSTRAQLAVDAYDNFEAYMPWNLPLHWLWRSAVRTADLVTAAGPQLAERLQSHRVAGHPTEVLAMAADPEFVTLDRIECRRQLGLPLDAPLLGYIGSWTKDRGTHLLLDAFRIVRAVRPDVRLVLSGRPPAEALQTPGVIGSGYVADAQLPALVNAVDVACVITAETGFGLYSYPAKLCEAMACGVPIAATATPAVRWMLGERDACMAPLADAEAYARCLLDQLTSPRTDYGPQASWASLAARYNALLSSVERRKR